METQRDLWKRVASELEDSMRQDLSGIRTRGGAVNEPRGVVRTRGATRGGVQRGREPFEHACTVVVEASTTHARPDAQQIRDKLQAYLGTVLGLIDLYYIVPGKHWAALGPRELNPDDEEYGEEHRLLLRSLQADFALVSTGKSFPEWCGAETQVIEW